MVHVMHFHIIILDYIQYFPFIGVAMTEKKDFTRAVDYFSKALQINPNHEPSQKHLKSARMQQMKKEQN